MVQASLFVLDLTKSKYNANTKSTLSHINVGSGEDITILNLARTIADVTWFKGEVETDPSKPGGTLRKLMDVSRLNAMGWTPNVELKSGLAETYR